MSAGDQTGKPRLILHIPHSSERIPKPYRDQFLLDDAALEQVLRCMTDHYTDELFHVPGAERIAFPVSRLLLDPERFADDTAEPMAERGMGVIYTRTHDGQPLRRSLNPTEREALLRRYYRPHHQRLEQMVTRSLAAHGAALIIDCHSFPSRRLPYEDPSDHDRPEICIGTDPFHTPDGLRDRPVLEFLERGFSVALNRPFAGTIVPLRYYRRDVRVTSVMIELRRDLYMDEDTGEKHRDFNALGEVLADVLMELAVFCRGTEKTVSIRQE